LGSVNTLQYQASGVAARPDVPRYDLAVVHMALGQRDEAFGGLDNAYERHDKGMTYIKVATHSTPCAPTRASRPSCDEWTSRPRPSVRRQIPLH